MAVLGACAQTGSPGAIIGGTDIAVGTNLIGEKCRLVAVEATPTDTAGSATPPDVYEIRCGDWEQASGRIVRVASDTPLAPAVDSGPWRRRIDEFAACESPNSLALGDGVPALQWQCATRRGGWPYAAVAADADGHTNLADGIPAALPVIERSIVLLSGGKANVGHTPAGSLDANDRNLYSAGDLDRYRLLLHRAQYFNYRGDHAEAERLYREALALQEGRLSETSPSLAFVLMHLALELSNQGRFAEAEPLFARAEKAVAASVDRSDEARLLGYKASHLANQRRSQKAIEVARQATDLRDSVAGPTVQRASSQAFLAFSPQAFTTAAGTNQAPLIFDAGDSSLAAAGDIAQSKSLEGAMLLRQGDLDGADAAFDKALTAVDRAHDMPAYWRLRVLSLKARVRERRGDTTGAIALLTDAIDAHMKAATGSPEEAMARLQLSQLQVEHGNRNDAIATFRSALAILQAAKQSVPLEQAMPFFRASLEAAAAAPAERDSRSREMFQVAQLARSPRTAQSIDLAAARLARGDQDSARLIRDLQDARRERDTVAQTLSRVRADPVTLAPQLAALEERQRVATDRAAELERLVQAAAPRYQMALDTPIEPDDLQAVLGEDEALVQIVVGKSDAVGFLVDRGGIVAYPVEMNERSVEHAVTFLRAPFDAIVGARFDIAKAYGLYRQLFGPVETRLKAAKHVIFVGSGALQSLPPGVLVTAPPEPGAVDYASVAWMVRQQATTMAPSVQSFVRLRTAPQSGISDATLVGFGDFVPTRNVEGILAARGLPSSCRAEVENISRLPPLPNTGPELRAAAGAFPAGASSVYLGKEFTEGNIRRATAGHHGIIYFATHALLPQELSCVNEPLLVASEGDGSADGLLTGSKIMDLSLDADLVILSACNTAGPDGRPGGDSLSGLARAFFYAGARSLLVTHWQIPDGPTRELMGRFFAASSESGSSGSLRTAEALRRAQLALIGSGRLSHPLNWGAFTVVGDGGRPAPTSKGRVGAGTS